MKIFRGINEILDLGFNPEGIERKELMVEHTVSFSFERSVYIKLEKGDSITHNGKLFYLKDDYIPTINKSTNGFVYDLTFYDIMERMKDIKLKYNGETDFKLTVTGGQFLDVVVSSFSGITKGSFPTDIKEIHFENVSVFDALNLITETYDTEWWLNGSTLNLSKCEFGAPVILRLDTELEDISVSQSSETLVTRLYAKGSTRNIPKGYSQDNRLKLATGFIDLIPDLPESKIIEGVHIFEDIYPRQTTSIVEVIQGSVGDTPIFTIRGNNAFTITQNDVIPGQPLKIAFNTGNLAGREFELIIRADNKFEIKYIQDGELVIPNLTLKPAIGDEFFFFNFNAESVLPTLISQAENELLVAAQDYLDNLGSQLVYDCETRSIHCEQNVIDLEIGQVVTIQSENIGSVITRIRAYEKQLLNSFECKYQAGDYSKYSRLKEIANRIKDSTPELQTLKSTLEYVFQDGIVTETELKSIEAILTNLSVERGQLNAQYLVVRGNVNLINKTPLETAWSNYQTAFVEVETAINNAIADKLVSDAEKDNIDNKISIYSTRTNEFATALENAREAIENYMNQGLLDVVDQNKQYLQDQIDGVVDNWFYPYSPTLANYPASDWTTNEIKDRHIGDTFTNTQQAPATDAGKSWRFVKNGTVYSWTQIADSDAVLALQKAAQAQSTADGKSTTYLIQPTSYKLGDMWVLAADQTVNGIAYKSGEILTATQDSTTYNQAHWVKKVRYTDDTAVENLQIGGVNLIDGTSEDWKTTNIVSTWGYPYGGNSISPMYSDVKEGTYYTFSVEVKDIPLRTKTYIRFFDSNNQIISNHGSKEWTEANTESLLYTTGKAPAGAVSLVLSIGIESPAPNTTTYYRKGQLEEGSKRTSWGRSQNDILADITTAKQEALTAAGNAQTTANSLKDFTDTAFRDGIIDRSESIAIEKYKNTLNDTMAKAEASFLKVFGNAYLEGTAKTDLDNAKINLWGQRDTLLSAINTAIADGKTTVAEKNAVDSAFNTFNSLMSAFQSALEEANKAIQAKLDSLSKGYVDNLEIGGRNLLIGTAFSVLPTSITARNNYAVLSIDSTEKKTANNSLKIATNVVGTSGTDLQIVIYSKESVATVAEKYRVSFWAKSSIADTKSYWRWGFGSFVPPVAIGTEWIFFEFQVDSKIGDGRNLHPYFDKQAVIWISDIKVERGNKTTQWSPAPEDVQAAIDEAVVKATFWSINLSSPVIYKDAINAATSGAHSTVIVNGELHQGTNITNGGFITVTPNGETEAGTATASPVTIAPTNADGKTSYTVRLYNNVSKSILLDTQTIPVVFKGASGVNAINASLSNEADVLPASPEGVVSDYTGSGTIIRVFEGATELTYGTGNGQYQVSVSGSGIAAGTPTTVGNTRVYGVASNMTLDNATLTFTITGKTASGISFSLTKVQTFAKSRTGQKGADGTSITLVDVEFAKNTNPTTAPTTGWTTTAPTLAEGEQLWTRTKTSYSTGNPTYSTPANITPKKGDTGTSISAVVEEYYLSTSNTSQTGGSWSETPPTWVQGKYIWSRVKITYTNPSSTATTTPYLSPEWDAINNTKLTAEQAQLAADGYMRARYVRQWMQGSDQGDYNSLAEIKIFDKNSNNVALGKTVTGRRTAATIYPYTNITDGSINTYGRPDLQTPAQADWFQVDLGQVYYDIESIIVFGYPAGRTYFGTKTEISTDGVNWTPVFDSAKSGTYRETAAGNIISLRPHEVLAKTLKSQAITDKFGATVNGGLISTVITEYRELNSEQVTGLISGIQGANKNLPFLVAGGTYAEGIAGTAKAIIRHDGSVKFTDGEFHGTIYATDGEFTGTVTATSGRVGSLRISGSALTNEGFDDDAYIILRNDPHGTFVGIGGNVLPASSGLKAVGRFENKSVDGFFGSVNYSLLVEASGASRNVGIYCIGDLLLKGGALIAEKCYTDAGYTNSITLNIDKFSKYLFNPPMGSINTVYMPSGSQVLSAVGSVGLTGSNWCFDIGVSIHYSSSGGINLRGVSGGIIVNNNGDVVGHNDTYTYGGIQMKKGDHVTLRYYSVTNRWLIIDHQY